MLRTILKPLSFVPALIMMYIIFSFSAQDGDMSGQLSYQASVKIIETADYVFNANLSYDQIDEWANKIDFITRKLAHMTEYFALAIAVSFPLYVYGMHGILLMLFAGLICVGFACGDEYHQSFVAGRSPSMRISLSGQPGVKNTIPSGPPNEKPRPKPLDSRPTRLTPWPASWSRNPQTTGNAP